MDYFMIISDFRVNAVSRAEARYVRRVYCLMMPAIQPSTMINQMSDQLIVIRRVARICRVRHEARAPNVVTCAQSATARRRYAIVLSRQRAGDGEAEEGGKRAARALRADARYVSHDARICGARRCYAAVHAKRAPARRYGYDVGVCAERAIDTPVIRQRIAMPLFTLFRFRFSPLRLMFRYAAGFRHYAS